MASRKKTINDNRVAVIGISSILPGGENINECWEMIRAGLDKLDDLPADRCDVTAYYNPKKGVKDKIYCKRGGFIPDFDFDAREFGMNMFQVEDSDTNQTLSLLKVKEALEDGGVNPFSKEKKNIGVVLGIGGGQKSSHEFYSRMNYAVVEKVLRKIGLDEAAIENAVEKYKNNFPEWRLDSFPGMLGNVTAGRCTNVFNLKGMNCVVDAACASSLIALKVACDELLHGDCDEMICGATCTDNSLAMYMAFSKTPVFSTDQSLTAYDENTKGMLIGEGSAMLLLKRYEDAVRDGDRIHAVIRGVASSSDGKASGIYSPTIDGQELAINRAYNKAGVSPGDVTLVEGHGTGTPVGDRIELTGLKNVFQPYFKGRTEEIAVGSIKSQIGHLKAVAGLAGLVKVIMALKHKTLPASINVKNPPLLFDNTKIQDSPLYINTQMRPWFTDGNKSRIAGVSSFGFGGANYHCVVEEAEKEQTKPYRMHDLPQPVVISAASPQSLLSAVSKELSAFETEPRFSTLHSFRSKFALKAVPKAHARVGFLSKSVEQTKRCLEDIKAKLSSSSSLATWTLIRQGCHYRREGLTTSGKTAALFSGQGAQYLNMFSDVAMNWPTFRESVVKMDKVSEEVCKVRASKIMYPRKPYDAEAKLDDSEISSVQNAQITTVASSIGSYNIFKKAGFKPDFTAGHSLGEFSALYASGCFPVEEELFNVIAHRGKIMTEANSGNGAMLAVIGQGASSLTISTPNVTVGNSNSPDQVVLTGESSAIDKEAEILKKKFKVVKLNVSDAFHSTHMKAANEKFMSVLKKVNFQAPQTKVYSNVNAQPYDSNVIRNLEKHMTSSVEFQKQILNMYEAGARVFVEFGPRNTLIKLVENVLKDKRDIFTVAVNNTSRQDSETQLRECAVKMAVAGIPLHDFDPWVEPNRFKINEKSKKKTTLRLSAATYVSKKTLKARNAVMNDGFKVSTSTAATTDNSAIEAELKASKEQNKKLMQQLKLATADIDKLKKRIETAEAQSTTMSVSNDFVEINTLKRHREMIVGMLSEYDKMMDSLSQIDQREQLLEETPTLAVDNNLLEKAEQVVMQVLAEKTGYEVEMIEPDMELETELGIDSIKRVEILSEVQTLLQIEAKDVDALSRTRTVGEVVNAMKFEIGSSGTGAPAAAIDTSVIESTGVAANQGLLNKAEQTVMQVLADKTGYEVEMIESDMELETELGIDSIKRVEILSEVQSILNIEAKDVDALSRTRTVGEVVNCMKIEIQGLLGNVETLTTSAIETAKPAKNAKASEAAKVVMQVLADKTGYEVEMIEPDMELETELGIDSIKRVEILSEVQDLLSIEAKDVDALSRTRTVGEVIDAMMKEIGGVSGDPVVNETPTVSKTQTVVDTSLLSKAADVVLRVLAEKTGYEVDMIEDDMELETELGIDSIKRVEILSEVQELLSIEAQDVDALSRTRTVGEVIDAMKKEIGGGSAQVSSASKAVATAVNVDTGLLNKAEEVVLKVLAEKTGYEVDMIENDMELETELGIDSIKRVEILSEVQDMLSIEAKDVDALSRTRTVGEVIEAMKKEIGGSSPVQDATTAEPASTKVPADSGLFKKAEEVVLQVLAEKTGYEVDMIENDMELETELGIDSIKRVEILSEVQDLLSIEAKDVDALSRTRTVGEVIEAMKKEIGGASASNDVKSAAVTTAAPSKTNDATTDAEKTVLKVLADKTGYEVDMIEHDMELETELGIDSIKRVEILSEVQSILDIEAKDVDALSRTRTVGEVIDALKKELNVATSPSSGNSSASSFLVLPSNKLREAQEVVFKVLADKTGYEVEMIEEDMELETELGIDSIKRVEILSEVQDILGIEAKNVDALSRTRTVGEVIVALQNEISTTSTKAVKQNPKEFNVSIFDYNNYSIRAKGCESLNISYPEIVESVSTKDVSLKLGSIVVCGDSSLARDLKAELKVSVTHLSSATTEEAIKKLTDSLPPFETFIYVQSQQPPAVALLYMKHIKKHLSGRKQIIVVVKGDGQLGYSGKFNTIADVEKYSLCGLVKTMALEWTDVKTKFIDVHESETTITPSVINELYDSNAMTKEVGYKSNKRYEVTIKGLASARVATAPTKNDVWLVAGGARGITPLCIRELAKQVKGGHYILVGRSSLAPIPAWAKKFEGSVELIEKDVQKAAIQYIKSQGEKPKPMVVKQLVKKVFASLEVNANMKDIGKFCNNQVEYVSCDITDSDAVKKLVQDLKNKGLSITGFFHASGVLRDKLLVEKKLEDFNLVYNTKVKGFINIYSQLDISALKHCVLFSSLAGFYGNAGQSDYSMANEVLNKLAYYLSAQGVSVKAFDFGPWDGGMVSPALKKHFIENNVQIIDREGGAETVANIMLNSSRKQILIGNWGLKPQKPTSSKHTVEMVFNNEEMLKDHSIKGVPVVPFTFTLSEVIKTVQGVYVGYYLKEVEQVTLFRGIKFDKSQQVKCKLVAEVVNEEPDGLLRIAIKLSQELSSNKYVPSYNVKLSLSPKLVSLKRESLSTFTDNFEVELQQQELYNGETLFHGPKFQSIAVAKLNDEVIVGNVDVSKAQFDGVELPRLLLDTVFQLELVHARQIGKQASLPNGFANVQFSLDFFNGSRSYKNLFIVLKKTSESTDSTWVYNFSIQDNEVLVKGKASVTLSKQLSYQ